MGSSSASSSMSESEMEDEETTSTESEVDAEDISTADISSLESKLDSLLTIVRRVRSEDAVAEAEAKVAKANDDVTAHAETIELTPEETSSITKLTAEVNTVTEAGKETAKVVAANSADDLVKVLEEGAAEKEAVAAEADKSVAAIGEAAVAAGVAPADNTGNNPVTPPTTPPTLPGNGAASLRATLAVLLGAVLAALALL